MSIVGTAPDGAVLAIRLPDGSYKKLDGMSFSSKSTMLHACKEKGEGKVDMWLAELEPNADIILLW